MSGAGPAKRDLVCMGEAMVEFTRTAPTRGPRPDSGPESGPESGALYLQGFGGDTSNCAVAAARQGATVGYITALGRDRFGDMLARFWEAEGIDISGVIRDPDAPTAVYFIEPAPRGRDFTYYRQGSPASRFTPDQVPQAVIRGARILHVSAISQAISETAEAAVDRAIAVALGAGVEVAYDTNLRLNLMELERARRVINATARKADILLPSDDEARLLTGCEAVADILSFYLQYEPRVLALKCGEKGAYVAAAGRIEHIPALAVATVDTSGAGDTFDGALLARLAAGDDPFEAARLAVVAAGLSTAGYGAVAAIPDRAATLIARDHAGDHAGGQARGRPQDLPRGQTDL